MKRAIRLFMDRIMFWRKRAIGITEWHQDGNTIYVTIQSFGLFKAYKDRKIHCDVDIDPELVIQSQ